MYGNETSAKEAYARADVGLVSRQIDADRQMRAQQTRAVSGAAGMRQMEIPGQVDKLDQCLIVHGDTVHELLSRLEAVLRQEKKAESTTLNEERLAPAPPTTSIGQRLHDFSGRLNNLTERLNDALRRLEV